MRFLPPVALHAFIFLLMLVTGTVQAMPAPQPPDVPAHSHFLIDFDSGQVLAEHDPDRQVAPASITKLMTAYIIFSEMEKGRLKTDTPVTISEKAWRMGGSRMFVEVGTQVPAWDLIQGMMVQSGNDATVALAEHVAGTEDAFADYMNATAKQLGMTRSHFLNASGWPSPEHYTTARDIATLARALIRDFPEYYKVYSERSFTYNGITQPNRNRLLGEGGVDGMKTGFTDDAGYCVVNSAKRGDMRLISVVLGTKTARERFIHSAALLNYGFRFFETRKIATAGTASNQVPVWKGANDAVAVGPKQDQYVTVQKSEVADVTLQTELESNIVAPVALGAPLGKITVNLAGKPLTTVPLYALQTVEAGGWWKRLKDDLKLRWINR